MTRPPVVYLVALIVPGLCGHAALTILEVYDGRITGDALGLYFLGKSLFCAVSLVLASAFLAEVRGLREDAVRAGLVVHPADRPDPVERVVGHRLSGGLAAILPLAICIIAALMEFNLIGQTPRGGGVLSWYFLGKGLYCFQALLLAHATLRELRALRGPDRTGEEP